MPLRRLTFVCALAGLLMHSGCRTPEVYTAGHLVKTDDKYMQTGDYDRAIEDCNRQLRKYPADANLYINRGAARACKGDMVGALTDYNRAIMLNSRSALAYLNRGSTYFKMDQLDRAMRDFERAVSLDPRSPQALYNRGSVWQKKGDNARAMADFDRAIALDPKCAPAYFNRAASRLRTNDPDGALADYQKAVALAPVLESKTHQGSGDAYRMKGDLKTAAACYRKSIAKEPNESGAYLRLAVLEDQWGNREESLRLYGEGISRNPKATYPRLFYYLELRRMGRDGGAAGLASAVPDWKDAWAKNIGLYLMGALPEADLLAESQRGEEKKLAGQACEANYYVGMMRLLDGKKEEAKGFFEKSLATGKTSFVEYECSRIEQARL